MAGSVSHGLKLTLAGVQTAKTFSRWYDMTRRRPTQTQGQQHRGFGHLGIQNTNGLAHNMSEVTQGTPTGTISEWECGNKRGEPGVVGSSQDQGCCCRRGSDGGGLLQRNPSPSGNWEMNKTREDNRPNPLTLKQPDNTGTGANNSHRPTRLHGLHFNEIQASILDLAALNGD